MRENRISCIALWITRGHSAYRLATAFLMATLLCPRLDAATLYGIGIEVGADLYRIDQFATEPTAVGIGETGLSFVTDLAIDPASGRFFAPTYARSFSPSTPGDLYEIDPANGSVSLIGSLGVLGINALDFDMSGRLFGWSHANRSLYQIDTLTGTATAVGRTRFQPAGDFAFDHDGTLFGADSRNRLIRINPEDGDSEVVGPFGIETSGRPGEDGMLGLEIDTDGTLYGARGIFGSDLIELYTVDKTTGTAELIGEVSNATGFGVSGIAFAPEPTLKAGDADQNLTFDQLDLVQVQVAAKYLTGQAATWGGGDWNGAPGGSPGNPPIGDGVFDQLDIIAAQLDAAYLAGPYAAVQPTGRVGDSQTSVIYNTGTGELAVDAPTGVELTSINIDSAAGIFTGESARSLGGSFDNDADNNIFKATFGGRFGSLSFGNVAPAGLTEDFVLGDVTVVGSLAGGGDLGNVDLVYVPEPTSVLLLASALVIGLIRIWHPRL